MIQEQIIETFRKPAVKNTSILAAILYGSFARKTANLNSDIDIAILIDNKFDKIEFESFLKEIFQSYNILHILTVDLRNKVVVYFNDIPKIEIAFISSLEEIKRNYIGSKIPNELIAKSVLFDKSNTVLQKLIEFNHTPSLDTKKLIEELIPKFIYEFESCSTAHSRSESYHFYFFYNISLNIATQLRYLASGKTQYVYLPKGMSFDVIQDEKERQIYYDMSASTFLPDGNKKKRHLLDFFYIALQKLEYKELPKIKSILEQFYERDFIWNFRDIAKFNPKANNQKIFRTSSLSAYQKEDNIKAFLKDNNIDTIIDLRAPREVKEHNYDLNFIEEYTYLNAPLDPWNQPKWFKELDHSGKKNHEIAYHFFIAACKEQVYSIFQTILNSHGAIAIHCHAGKDRTGLIILLINLLIKIDYNDILADYLASEMDTKKSNFDIYYKIIEEEGGIEKYLKSCKLSETELAQLKIKLSK